MPKATALTESFSGNVLDITKWDVTGSFVVASNRVKLTDASLSTKHHYDFNNSSVFLKVSISGSDYCKMAVTNDTGGELAIGVIGKIIYFSGSRDGRGEDTSLLYNSSTMSWWRIRDRAGVAFFDTSSDSKVWATRFQYRHHMNFYKSTVSLTSVETFSRYGFGDGPFGEGRF